MAGLFTCDACGGTFEKGWSDGEALAEARQTFTADELRDPAVVCDPCLKRMRAEMPDLEERYRTAP